MDLSNKGAEGYEIFNREMTPTNSLHSFPSPIFQSVASATTLNPTRSAGHTDMLNHHLRVYIVILIYSFIELF
jgi:hypothetical protein